MTDAKLQNLTVEQPAYRLRQQCSRPDGSPGEDWFRAERELRIERGTKCRLCTRSCRTRDARESGMRCGATRCGSGKATVRTSAELSGNLARLHRGNSATRRTEHERTEKFCDRRAGGIDGVRQETGDRR